MSREIPCDGPTESVLAFKAMGMKLFPTVKAVGPVLLSALIAKGR